MTVAIAASTIRHAVGRASRGARCRAPRPRAVNQVRLAVAAPAPNAGPRAAWTAAGDFDGVHDLFEAGAVVDVAARQHERQGPSGTVTGEVDLRGQSSSGSSDGVIRFARFPDPPFAPAAC
jgi:hypothetical protein